jgi:hypothetical protein
MRNSSSDELGDSNPKRQENLRTKGRGSALLSLLHSFYSGAVCGESFKRPYPSLRPEPASARLFTGRMVRSSSLNSGLTNDFPNPYPIYKSAEFIASKRISDVRFYGSYVLSKLYGNFPGSYRTDNG